MADFQLPTEVSLSNGAAAPPERETLAPPAPSTSAAKRQRRPSVRLGEIGAQPPSSFPQEQLPRRIKQQWRLPSHTQRAIPSKIRPLTNLAAEDFNSASGEENPENPEADSAIRRIEKEGRLKKREEEGYREDWESGRERNSDMEMDSREWQREKVSGGEDGGVRAWLNGLGLGRYGPVFEIHEVDDEVLPLLTLEDLKDMGINAVGSRRKMYCAIQRLGRNVS